jgi:hypothetical protein
MVDLAEVDLDRTILSSVGTLLVLGTLPSALPTRFKVLGKVAS